MKRFKNILPAFTAIIIIMTFAAGCNSSGKEPVSTTIPKSKVQKVELISFHPENGCASCQSIQKNSRDVAEQDFKDEMASGKLEYKSLLLDDPANRPLIDSLGVTGSSLYLVVEGDDGKTTGKQIKDAWLYWDKPEQCKEIIADELSRYL